MKRLLPYLLITFIAALFTVVAFAQDVVPMEQPVNQLLELIKNYKTLAPLALSVAVINLVVSFLKTDFVGGFFKNTNHFVRMLIITVLGQLVGILNMISTGMSLSNAIVLGLISSGGAVAIYEAWNNFKKGYSKGQASSLY